MLHAVATAAFLIGGIAPAHAAWLEASTPHFRVFADSNEKAITAYASKLERFDRALRLLRGDKVEDRSGANRLTVYVVRDAAAVRKLCGAGCRNVYGFYVPRAGGSIAFTPRRSGSGSRYDLDAETVLFHEYTHHFLFQNWAAAYPAWFSEGFAEFNGTANVLPDGTTWVGVAPGHRAYALLETKMTAEQLLGYTGRGRRDAATLDALYGFGWLLTHYLTFEKARAGQLDRYLTAINKGKSSLDAGRAAFGDLHQLDRDLQRYLLRARVPAWKLPAAWLPIGPVTVRTLPPGEAATMPVRMRSDRGVDRQTAIAVATDARRIAAAFPADPAAQSVLAEAEYDTGDLDAADAAADRAIGADPRAFDALLYKGMVAHARLMRTPDAPAADWAKARRWYLRANRIDPDDAGALMLFYDSFVQQGIEPTENAVAGLRSAYALAPEDGALRWRMVRLHLRAGALAEARTTLAPLAFDPHVDPATDPAARLLARIDAGAPPAELVALAEARDPEPAPVPAPTPPAE